MKNSHLLLRRGRRLLSLLAILALLLGASPALAADSPIPEMLVNHTNDRTCRLNWRPTENALSYHVYRALGDGAPEYLTSVFEPPAILTDLFYNQVYTFTVRADYGDGMISQPSIPFETRPIEPTFITVCAEIGTPGEPEVYLAWDAVPGAGAYLVFRMQGGQQEWSTTVNQTYCVDSYHLQVDQTYQYVVYASGFNSISAMSHPVSITVLGRLEDVQVSAKVVGNGINLTWKPVPLAVRYQVYRYTDYDHETPTIYHLQGTSFSQTNLSYDSFYTYLVKPFAANEATSESASLFDVKPLRPPVLTGLSEYGPPTTPAVKLSWNAVNHANSYQVYRSVNGGAYSFLKGTTGLFINDNSVQLGKTYYYKVQARGADGALSFLSALRGVKVKGVLAAPAISSLTSASNSAYLKWGPVAGAKSYAIYRSVNGGAFQFLKGTTGLFIADAGLTYGALYSYRVQAKADSGAASLMSVSRSIRIPAQPATPAISSLSLAGTTATLTWGKVNGAVSYYIYRSVNGGAYSFIKGTTATFIKDNNLETGKTYAYRVRANGNAGVYSALSAARSIKVATLATPVIASLANGGTTTATLTWGKVNGATSYTIYRSVNGGAFSFLKGTTATFIKDAGLTMGSSYAYRVQANGAGGLKSALSAARSITIE